MRKKLNLKKKKKAVCLYSDRSGSTLTETLLSLLIIGFSGLVIAGTVGFWMNDYSKTVRQSDLGAIADKYRRLITEDFVKSRYFDGYNEKEIFSERFGVKGSYESANGAIVFAGSDGKNRRLVPERLKLLAPGSEEYELFLDCKRNLSGHYDGILRITDKKYHLTYEVSIKAVSQAVMIQGGNTD